MKTKTIIANEKTKLLKNLNIATLSKQDRGRFENLERLEFYCNKYGLDTIEFNALNYNLGYIGIELLKKVLNKQYLSNNKNHNNNNIINLKLNNQYLICECGSLINNKPAKYKPNNLVDRLITLVVTATTQAIYIIKTDNIKIGERLTLSRIQENGKMLVSL